MYKCKYSFLMISFFATLVEGVLDAKRGLLIGPTFRNITLLISQNYLFSK